jgi:hypothetical protein
MDTTDDWKSFANQLLLKFGSLPWLLKELVQNLASVLKNPQHSHYGRLMEEFPHPSFRNFLTSLLEDVILMQPPSTDELDRKLQIYPASFPRSKVSLFEKLLIEASSNVEAAKSVYKCVETCAIQLPGIGIAELLVSSPLYRILVQCHTSTSGTTATQIPECVAAQSCASIEAERKPLFFSPKNPSEDFDLCEELRPKKRERIQEHSSKTFSSM